MKRAEIIFRKLFTRVIEGYCLLTVREKAAKALKSNSLDTELFQLQEQIPMFLFERFAQLKTDGYLIFFLNSNIACPKVPVTA